MTVHPKHLPTLRGKLALSGVVLCLAAGAQAAEDINRDFLPGAPKRDLAAPKLSIPTTPSDEWRKDLMKELNSPLPTGPILPPTQFNRNVTREQQEMIDKKRNWIFVSPQDSITSPEQAMRLREQRPDETEPYQSVMIQFLDGDRVGAPRTEATNRANTTVSSANPSETKADIDRRDDPLNRSSLKDDLQLGAWGKREDPLSVRSLTGSNVRETNSTRETGGSNSTTRMLTDPASNGSTFSLANSALMERTVAIRERRDADEEKRQRNLEFQQLLDRRAYPTRPDTSTGGTADPINLLTDSSVSALNAVAPRGGNTLPTAPRLNAMTPQPIGAPSSSLALPDSGNRGGGLPLGVNGQPMNQPQRPVFTPRPAVLEIPRRKL